MVVVPYPGMVVGQPGVPPGTPGYFLPPGASGVVVAPPGASPGVVTPGVPVLVAPNGAPPAGYMWVPVMPGGALPAPLPVPGSQVAPTTTAPPAASGAGGAPAKSWPGYHEVENVNLDREFGRANGYHMAVDTLYCRPLGVAASAVGTVFLVGSLPFTLPGGNTGEAAARLVGDPLRFTFQRPLGSIECIGSRSEGF